MKNEIACYAKSVSLDWCRSALARFDSISVKSLLDKVVESGTRGNFFLLFMQSVSHNPSSMNQFLNAPLLRVRGVAHHVLPCLRNIFRLRLASVAAV